MKARSFINVLNGLHKVKRKNESLSLYLIKLHHLETLKVKGTQVR
jgi:hypothetical protein